MRQQGLPRYFKRAVDVTVAAAALMATAPIMALTAVAVRVGLGSPVLFRQTRPGFEERPFVVLKFRTMTDRRGPDGELLPDDQRLPPLGKFLRRTSLDELPQLFNVLRGELSLVGPRPLLMQYLSLYSDRQRRRHEVLPGITGWAQVHGRNAVSWPARFEHDVWYVEHWTPWLDFVVLAKTAGVLLSARGVSRPGHATMPNFAGEQAEAKQSP